MDTKICANAKCLRTDKDLELAPLYCEIYFGLQNHKNKCSSYLCKNCLALGEAYRDKCINALYNDEPVIDIPRLSTGEEPEVIEIDSEPCNNNHNLETVKENVLISLSDEGITNLVNEVMLKINLPLQATACKTSLTTGLSELAVGYDSLDEKMSILERQVDEARTLYVSSRAKISNNSRTLHMTAVNIDTDGTEKVEEQQVSLKTRAVNEQQNSTRPLRSYNNIKRLKSKDNLTPPSGNEESQKIIPAEDSTVKNNNSVGDEGQSVLHRTMPLLNKQTFLFETPKTIPRIIPKVGDNIYAMKSNLLSPWSLGQVDEIITQPDSKKRIFKIKFETKKRSRAGSNTVVNAFLELTAKQIAYDIPCPFTLPVGTRVIGLFTDDCAVHHGQSQPLEPSYYAGIVAESPKTANQFRYLIFFDDGYAQYVKPTDVLLVCESSDPVWLDIHSRSQDFIKIYVQKYPERPMVRLHVGTTLSTELNGQWWHARVVGVDCSLVKMYFQAENWYEWIYRGSTRLSPLYANEKRLAESQTQNVGNPSPRGVSRNKQKTTLTIEYLYGNEDAFKDKPDTDKPDKKSNATGVPEKRRISPTSVPAAKPQQERQVKSWPELEGKIKKVSFPKGVPQPKEYEPHTCTSSCVIPCDVKTLPKSTNPLSIVLHFGWAREITSKNQYRKQVSYRAPCGRRLRDLSELHSYLMMTNFSLSIDYFCFDVNVDCDTEFVPSTVMWNIKDISYGREEVPVPCMNSLDHDYPEYVEYTPHSVKGNGIPLNLDQDFLVCCDCTDDCQDKEKCACWKLALESYKKTRKVTDKELIGYSYRRLKEHQVSAIYECNPRCKCRKTCLNRVVQNPTKWRLQVFKTINKGWAIRSLNDIPKGAYICIYAGQILTEHIANEDGKNYGDEYLADLDFIEVCEAHKKGYEAECVEPDDVDADDDFEVDSSSTKPKNISSSNRKGDDENEEDFHSDVNGIRTRSSKQSSKSSNGPSSSFMMQQANSTGVNNDEEMRTRDYFKKGEQCFIVDAKSIGSIGRYLNHSCSPNVYVQNVFIDTHDLRFPWVSFFTSKVIKAGTELTWDYNYEVGSVPGRILYCQCGSSDCRGRLL